MSSAKSAATTKTGKIKKKKLSGAGNIGHKITRFFYNAQIVIIFKMT